MFKWTVNWKFLPEDVFVGKELSILLLLLTVVGMAVFARKWIMEVWLCVFSSIFLYVLCVFRIFIRSHQIYLPLLKPEKRVL